MNGDGTTCNIRPYQVESLRPAILASTGLNPDLVVMREGGSLPRTSSGKIRRAEALLRYQKGELLPPKKVNSWLIAGALASSSWAFLRSRSHE